MKPLLYLLPNLLGDQEDHAPVLPHSVDSAVSQLDGIIAENEKQARRFLRRFAFTPPKTFREITIHLLNEHTTPAERELLIDQMKPGQKWGLVSDCGMPCLADPGSELVLRARERGVEIKALVGPSSIFLALVLSGLGGQRFFFRGYLPRDEALLIKEIKALELQSKQEKLVQLFIETPYRNEKMFTYLLAHLNGKTWVSLATDLTLPTETVVTHRVEQWKKMQPPALDKRPTVFCVKAEFIS